MPSLPASGRKQPVMVSPAMVSFRNAAAAYAVVFGLLELSQAVAGVHYHVAGLLGGPAVIASMFLGGLLIRARLSS